MVKILRWSIKPSEADIASFNGLHCARAYAECLRTGWRCPSCGRSAIELIRWSEIRGPGFRARYGDQYGMGWTIGIYEHHDHTSGDTEENQWDTKRPHRPMRFSPTLICVDCNNADGSAKRKLKLPSNWSFSPREIRGFISDAKPHSGHLTIDYDKAKKIYQGASRR